MPNIVQQVGMERADLIFIRLFFFFCSLIGSLDGFKLHLKEFCIFLIPTGIIAGRNNPTGLHVCTHGKIRTRASS